MSASAQTKLPVSDATRAKQSAIRTGTTRSPKTREKMRLAALARFARQRVQSPLA